MKSRYAGLTGGLIFLAGIGIIVGAVVSFARATHTTTTPTAIRQVLPPAKNLAVIRQRLERNAAWQNSHLFRHPHSQGIISSAEPAIRMRIPAIDVDAPVIQTAVISGQWQVADWAVGYLQGTGTVSQGNMVFAAHDDIKGEIFKRAGELVRGNRVIVYTRSRAFTYIVEGQKVVDPSDSQVLKPTANRQVTLITCAPYWIDGSRLVVTARFQSSQQI